MLNGHIRKKRECLITCIFFGSSDMLFFSAVSVGFNNCFNITA